MPQRLNSSVFAFDSFILFVWVCVLSDPNCSRDCNWTCPWMFNHSVSLNCDSCAFDCVWVKFSKALNHRSSKFTFQ